MPLLAVDKPLGLTSHDVVAAARRALGTRRVGHAGTLDPLATGVLLLLVEETTKLSQYLTGHDKTYLAWVTFGVGTPTLDAEGPVATTADAGWLTREDVETHLGHFLSLSEQRPPAFSAVKQAGVRSYAAARRGDLSEPPPRPAAYRQVDLLALAPALADLPTDFVRTPDAPAGHYEPRSGGRAFDLPPPQPAGGTPTMTALFRMTVGAGTYVRAFARDLGAELELPAHLAGLARTASGTVGVEECVTLAELPSARGIDPVRALGLPRVELSPDQAGDVRQGRRPPLSLAARSVLVDAAGIVALAEPTGPEGGYRLLRVFA